MNVLFGYLVFKNKIDKFAGICAHAAPLCSVRPSKLVIRGLFLMTAEHVSQNLEE